MDLIALHSQFRYIFVNHLFASFASKYSHIFAYKYIFDLKHVEANIRFKIFVLKQIFAKLQANFYSSEYLL
jgi:hypothetical protein